jgi:hypothetical protein
VGSQVETHHGSVRVEGIELEVYLLVDALFAVFVVVLAYLTHCIYSLPSKHTEENKEMNPLSPAHAQITCACAQCALEQPLLAHVHC